MNALGKDAAALVKCLYGVDEITETAGSSPEPAESNGLAINCAPSSLGFRANGIGFAITAEAVLQAAETLVLTANLQESADGSTGWADITDPATVLTLTGDTGGSTERGGAVLAFDLGRTTKDYVRVQVTPVFSAADTDTCSIHADVLFTGIDQLG